MDDVAVAADRRRQLQRADSRADAVRLGRHALGEGGHEIFVYFDGERQRVLIVVVEGRQRVARPWLRGGRRAAHHCAQRVQRKAVRKVRGHRIGVCRKRQRQSRAHRTADAVYQRWPGADAEFGREVRAFQRRCRHLRRRAGPGGVHRTELEPVRQGIERTDGERSRWRGEASPCAEGTGADGIAQFVVRDVRSGVPSQFDLASAGDGDES